MSLKPVVNGIERQYEGRLEVMHVNIQDPVGQAIGEEFNFEYTPTFILFDGDGKELWRMVGMIDPSKVEEALGAP
jgi:thioredoxin-like negative regulator of GroEL